MKRVWKGIGSILSMFSLCNSFGVTELERTGESTLSEERRSYERQGWDYQDRPGLC
jgi:hypothetical protein